MLRSSGCRRWVCSCRKMHTLGAHALHFVGKQQRARAAPGPCAPQGIELMHVPRSWGTRAPNGRRAAMRREVVVCKGLGRSNATRVLLCMQLLLAWHIQQKESCR